MSERTTGIYYLCKWAGIYELSQYLVRSWASRHEFVEQHMCPAVGQRILDLGCGTGSILNHLPKVEYVGVDANHRYIKLANDRFGSRGRFQVGDVTDVDSFPSGSFDLVIALGVMHHLDDEQVARTLDGVREVLRDGGRFVSHDPVLTDPQPRWSRWWVRRDRGRHVRWDRDLLALVQPQFAAVNASVTHKSLRIPFSEINLVCHSGHRTTSPQSPDHASGHSPSN